MSNGATPVCSVRPLFALGVWLVLLGAVGCAPPNRVSVESRKDPFFPELLETTLDKCVYRIDSSGQVHIAGRTGTEAATRRATARTTREAVGGTTTLPASVGAGPHGAIEQLLHVRMFFTPRPGKTAADPTMIDAHLRYLIVTAGGTALYGGTGFVTVDTPKRDQPMRVHVESSQLKLLHTTGDPPPDLGELRIRGKLRAQSDPTAAVDLLREIDQRAGPGR